MPGFENDSPVERRHVSDQTDEERESADSPPGTAPSAGASGAKLSSGEAVRGSGARLEFDRREALATVGLGASLAYVTPVLLTLSRARAGNPGGGAAVLAAAPVPAAAVGGAGNGIGTTTAVVKTVTGKIGGEVRRLARKDDVHRQEVIETAVSSASTIVFHDDTAVALGPNTHLKLDEFDPDPTRGKFVMTTGKGVLRFASGNLAKQSYEIRTPMAKISVTGTVLSVVTLVEGGPTAVMLQCPPRYAYRWQPEKQRQQLEQQKDPGTVTVESPDGQSVTLAQCDVCATISPTDTIDGIPRFAVSAPGVCPDWALDAIAELDELVGEPDTDDTVEGNPDDDDDDDNTPSPPPEPSPPGG